MGSTQQDNVQAPESSEIQKVTASYQQKVDHQSRPSKPVKVDDAFAAFSSSEVASSFRAQVKTQEEGDTFFH